MASLCIYSIAHTRNIKISVSFKGLHVDQSLSEHYVRCGDVQMKNNQISASQSYIVNYYNKPRQGTVEAQRKSCPTLPRKSRNTSQTRQELRWFLNGDFNLQIKEYLPLLTAASIQQVLLLLSRFSRVRLCVTPWTAAHQAPLSLGFCRQVHWSWLPFPSSVHESEKWKWSRSVVSDSLRPPGLQPTRLLHPWDFQGESTGVGCHCLLWPTGLLLDKYNSCALHPVFSWHLHV